MNRNSFYLVPEIVSFDHSESLQLLLTNSKGQSGNKNSELFVF